MELYFAFLLYFQCRVHVYWNLTETAVLSCYWRSLSSGFGVSLCAPPFIPTYDTHARSRGGRCLGLSRCVILSCAATSCLGLSRYEQSRSCLVVYRGSLLLARQSFSFTMPVRVLTALFLCCLHTHRPQYHSSARSFFYLLLAFPSLWYSADTSLRPDS